MDCDGAQCFHVHGQLKLSLIDLEQISPHHGKSINRISTSFFTVILYMAISHISKEQVNSLAENR